MIPGILELNSKVRYGLTSRNVPIYLFKPYDSTIGPLIVGCSQKDTTKNVIALVANIEKNPNGLSRGNLIRILGNCGNLEAEISALRWRYGNDAWNKFEKEKEINPPTDKFDSIVGHTFNVDPEGCIDIDDAIMISGNYVYICISDVAGWFNENSYGELWKRSKDLGQTLYMNGKVEFPLLPIQEECSLIPNKTRNVIALKFKWKDGMISEKTFKRLTIRNDESYTYESFYESKYAPKIKEIASFLAGNELTDSHDWIAQLMIFYNCEFARVLIEDKTGGILRIQDSPMYSISDINFLESKKAKYVYVADGGSFKHAGLNKEYYCHATSPIRRFADIFNQMMFCNYDLPEINIETLNKKSDDSKKFEREVFFMNIILSKQLHVVEGTVLNDHRIWVPEWKRIVTCKNTSEIGSKCTLRYSLDMNQTTWKRKMVFRCEDTNYHA